MDAQTFNVVTAPKTSTFQMRINPDIKKKVEDIYAHQGLTMTDAINIFFQQSINANGLPFLASPENEEYMKAKAWKRLTAEVQKGWDSVEREGWLSEEEVYNMLGVEP